MKRKSIAVLTLLAAVVGCGGGGGSSGSSASQSTLGGTVATGAPVSGATITVKDSLGAVVGTTTANVDGTYSISYDATRFTPPFVIKADGQSADSAISLISVATGSGTANVTQLTNAIASSLSQSGNPLDLISNPSNQTSLTQTAIDAADTAYRAALSGVMGVHGVTGSLLSSSYTASLDKMLDNVSATIQPSGQVILGTSAGKVGNDLVAGSSATTPYTTLVLQAGQLPTAGNASSLTAGTSSLSLGITDLETLRANLESCFALPAASRGTPQSPASACADAKFVVTSDYTQADGFKHSSYTWNSSNYDPALSHTNSYYAGLFGYMLTQSKYDGAKFLKPKIIRPIDSQGTTWAVKFPIQFADGTVDQLGDAIRTPFIVVKKITNLVSSSDAGYRFVGDQRDFTSFILPTVKQTTNLATGGTRTETGLNLQVMNLQSSTDATHRKPVMAKVTGKGLPAGGVYLAQKAAGTCGSYLPVTTYERITNNSAGNWANVDEPSPCMGVITLAYSYTNSYNTIGANVVAYLAKIGNDGRTLQAGVNNTGSYTGLATAVGNYLSDSDLTSIGEGEPYTFEITLSDGSTVSYINRLPTRPLSTAEATAFSYYPTFSAATKNQLPSFNGSTSTSVEFGTSAGNVHPWSVAIYWGYNNATSGTTSLTVPYTASSITFPCTGTAINSCGTSTNWTNSGANATYQIRSRTVDGVEVYSIITSGV